MTAELPVIHVQDLKKQFLLTHSGVGSLKTLLLWWKRKTIEELHVLRGISFDVNKGECVAIVGRNGAGKSTLLSLLARIYKPTSGTLQVNGRVAPLLELGAGFHQDLTGLQNIFVNASILGLQRRQIEERLDSIVEFSELINHIDSPVRTYSSGMIARLGFAVAIHVDADILLMDEVLSVGDFAFKEKCSARIDQLRESGKTIVIVSHGAKDIERIADRCIWLQNGLIEMEGTPEEVLTIYHERSTNTFDRESNL
jgi:lipopolysaccharide transport system ATP-binding protein